MKPKEDPSSVLHKTAVLRQQHSAEANERLGELLDSVDVYVWYIDSWLMEPEAAERPLTELLDFPQRCRELSLLGLLNIALEGLTTVAECLRAGIAYPGTWLLRNLLEASINAAFIAHEPTGLAGHRWINYNVHSAARLEEDTETAKEVIAKVKARFPDDDIKRDGWWAKTTDPDGTSKLLLHLIDRAKYVEKLRTTNANFLRTLRKATHQHELDMIRKANLSVHPMIAGHATNAHPITVLYWGSQATWDILKAYSAHLDSQSPTENIIQAHDRLETAAIKVGSAQVEPDQ